MYMVSRNRKNVLPIRLADDRKEKHANLLYLQDLREDYVSYFIWIKNLSRHELAIE